MLVAILFIYSVTPTSGKTEFCQDILSSESGTNLVILYRHFLVGLVLFGLTWRMAAYSFSHELFCLAVTGSALHW